MSVEHNTKALIEAVLEGELTFDSALEDHLDQYRGALEIPDPEIIQVALCYANLGRTKETIDLSDGPLTVARVVEEFCLGPFAPLLDDKEPDHQNEIRYPLGTLVDFSGEVCRVIGRRRVTILAMPREDEFEVFLESLEGKPMYFVGESMADPVEEQPEH